MAVSIVGVQWGRIEVEVDGAKTAFRDCRIGPKGAVDWDWTLTGTHHQPGIQPADVYDLVEQGVDAFVLTRGMELMLGVCPETLDYLEQKSIEYFVLETNEAVHRFNELTSQERRVAGVFHSTC